jgi:hypothetical protein
LRPGQELAGDEGEIIMKLIILWLLGVPFTLIVILFVLGVGR